MADATQWSTRGYCCVMGVMTVKRVTYLVTASNCCGTFLSRPGSTRDWRSVEGFEPRRFPTPSYRAHNGM